MSFRSRLHALSSLLPRLGLAMLTAWLLWSYVGLSVSKLTLMTVPGFAKGRPLLPALLFTAVFGLILFAVDHRMTLFGRDILPLALPISFTLYGAAVCYESGSMWACLGFSLLALAVLTLSFNESEARRAAKAIPYTQRSDLRRWMAILLIGLGLATVSLYFGSLLLFRYLTFRSPNFDFGIFTQMLHNMTESFRPVTTVERQTLLSHFAVHMSPTLYLLLPFAYLIPAPYVLVGAQVLLVFSGVIPLYLIGRRVGLSRKLATVISAIYLLYPALSSGGFYDFHENAFLAPLLLWTLYFCHTEKWLPALLFTLLTLGVKEDAAMYVAFLALYLIFGRKKPWHGLLMLLLSVGYFLFASHMLLQNGEGLMLGSRYYNIIGYDGSFTDLLRVAILNPALYVAEAFTTEAGILPDKLSYLLAMLLPLGCLPLLTKKPSRWLLILPLVVINLISDYRYQFDLRFQYSFGSGALLCYLACVNLADLHAARQEKQNEGGTPSRLIPLILSFACICSLFVNAVRSPSQNYYFQTYENETEQIELINQTLDSLDRSKSMTVSTLFIPHLYDVDVMYEQAYYKGESDLLVLDLRPAFTSAQTARQILATYRSWGYSTLVYHENVIAVLQAP